jgi:hypothetical protein
MLDTKPGHPDHICFVRFHLTYINKQQGYKSGLGGQCKTAGFLDQNEWETLE